MRAFGFLVSFAVAKDKDVCQNIFSLAKVLFFAVVSCATRKCPTKRAPDAGDSAAISSSFLRLIIFLVGRLRRPRPSAGNAIRWAVRA